MIEQGFVFSEGDLLAVADLPTHASGLCRSGYVGEVVEIDQIDNRLGVGNSLAAFVSPRDRCWGVPQECLNHLLGKLLLRRQRRADIPNP